MSIVFEATIKVNENDNSWYIELKDTLADTVENCLNIEEFELKMEELGQAYGGHIDEVQWLKDDNVTTYMMDDIRMKMSQTRATIEEQRGETITPVEES